VVTVPGPGGEITALFAEAAISFFLMTAVLIVSNTPRVARFTGWVAGMLVASFITFEAPLSGMSMNPARTLGSAVAAGEGTALWVYLAAPPLAMLAAAALYRAALVPLGRKVYCAKLYHDSDSPCPFRCGFMEAETPSEPAPVRVA
jgi:aquaporin Z